MSTYTPVSKWVDPLRGLAPGVSIATFFLVPPTGNPVVWVEQESIQATIDPITIVPDRSFMPVGVFFLPFILLFTSCGLVLPFFSNSIHPINDYIAIVFISQVIHC